MFYTWFVQFANCTNDTQQLHNFNYNDIESERVELSCWLQSVSKNDIAITRYNADRPALIIFGRDVAERVCYQKVICYPISPN